MIQTNNMEFKHDPYVCIQLINSPKFPTKCIYYDMKETANTHENFETKTSRPEQIVYTVHWTWFYKSEWGKLGNPPDQLL
jgi:hypothetical protein